MYQDFFGFKTMPFNITPDPRFLYLSPTHQEALAHLRYGIDQKKGFIVLTGEVGCGKTTLCRSLLDELDTEKYDTALIFNSMLNAPQLLRAILRELNEPAEEGAASVDLVEQIHNVLLKRVAVGKNVVLIIDEAQNLSYDVLEQVRLLSNLETNQEKLLQVLLIGQPEFKDKLKHQALRQLKQRILVHYDLTSLNAEQTRMYIDHRLTLTQGRGRPHFTHWAKRKIFKESKGIPRIINNLCDKALLSAFITTSNKVKYKDVKRATKEIQFI